MKTNLSAEDTAEIAHCIEWGLPLPPKFAAHFASSKDVEPRVEHDFNPQLHLPDASMGALFVGDNLDVLGWLKRTNQQPRPKLIYIDPPFDVGSDFHIPIELDSGHKIQHVAYSDAWGEGQKSFLHMLAPRLKAMVDWLDETGSIVVHCDYRTVAQIRLLLDRFLGPDRFRNEIIWHYTGGGRAKRYFSRKHDSLLWYSKSDTYTFNLDAVRVPYKATSGFARSGIVAKSGKHYQPHPKGTPVDDVWDIPIINPMAKERLGYPTQKPAALLERIILALSQEGDCVADFFCGSGTTLAVAAQNGRRWIGSDQSPMAISTTLQRLQDAGLTLFEHTNALSRPKLHIDIQAQLHKKTDTWMLKGLRCHVQSIPGLDQDQYKLEDGRLCDQTGTVLMTHPGEWIRSWFLVGAQSHQCLAKGTGFPSEVPVSLSKEPSFRLILIDIMGGIHACPVAVSDV